MKKSTISELTKEQLSHSLFEFMKQKPLEKINVKAITDDCGFPRSTFYYHFSDIYDLTSWALSQQALASLRRGGNGYALLWDDSLLCLFQDIQKNVDVCRCAINSRGIWRMADSYCQQCVEPIYQDTLAVYGDDTTDSEFLRFLTAFYGHALVNTFVHWFRGDMKATPEEMVELLDLVIKKNYFNTLEEFTEASKRGGIGTAYKYLS